MTHRIHYTVRQILSADLPTVREVETGERRAATLQELADMGIFPTPDPDHYSCAEQYRRDDELLIATGESKWEAHGIEIPGTLVTQGPNRFQELPPEVKARVLQARVIRSNGAGETALSIGQANVDEQSAAIAENVGTVDGAPLVDLSAPENVLDEVRRLVQVPDSGLEIVTIPMAQVDQEAHVVVVADIEPHRWAGERRF